MALTNSLASSRPTAAERRAQLAEAAAQRFSEMGFHGVSIADVAGDVGVTAPALYRHFRSKQDLLAAAIGSGLDRVESTLSRTEHDPLEILVAEIAELVLDRRDLWILLQREARFLDPELRAVVRQQFRGVVDQFVARLQRTRPELSTQDAQLLVTAATAALASPSIPRSVPRRLVSQELAHIANAVLQVPCPVPATDRSDPGPPEPPEPESRTAALLENAVDLFFCSGYAAVSVDDIGAAVGIAGPSIYHHFATKSDILVAAFSRATDRLAQEYAQSRSASQELAGLVDPYIGFCLRNRTLVGVYVSEANNLPVDQQRRIRSVLRGRITEWTADVRAQDESVDERIARLRSLTALTVIDDLVRLGSFHQRPRIFDEIHVIAVAILTGATGSPGHRLNAGTAHLSA